MRSSIVLKILQIIPLVFVFAWVFSNVSVAQETYDCWVDISNSDKEYRVYTDEDISIFVDDLASYIDDNKCEFDLNTIGGSTPDECTELQTFLQGAGYTDISILYCQDPHDYAFCLPDLYTFNESRIVLDTSCKRPTEVEPAGEAEFTCHFPGATQVYTEQFFRSEILNNNPECFIRLNNEDCGERSLCQGNQYVTGAKEYCCRVDDPPEEEEVEPVGYTDSNTGCNNVGEEDKNACLACMYENSDQENGDLTGAVWTAIGCVDPSPSGLITRLYQIGVGIVGGLLLIIKVPQIVIAYNSNNPEKKQEAQAGIWNVAGGLLLLIFASAVLEALGLHVLGLPRGFI